MRKPVSQINQEEDWNADVGGQEVAGTPVLWEKDRESIDECQNWEGDESNPSAVWLEEGFVGDLIEREVLRQVGFAESEVRDAAACPGDEAGCVSEVDEPVEDDGPAVGTVQVGKSAKER